MSSFWLHGHAPAEAKETPNKEWNELEKYLPGIFKKVKPQADVVRDARKQKHVSSLRISSGLVHEARVARKSSQKAQ